MLMQNHNNTPIKLSKTHSQAKYSNGVGLLEIMISILVLATAAMGYALLQNRAAVVSNDAIQRTYALAILDNLSNQIRLNVSLFGDSSKTYNPTNPTEMSVSSDKAIIQNYLDLLKENKPLDNSTCIPAPDSSEDPKKCSYEDLVVSDVNEARNKAAEVEMDISAVACPLQPDRLCVLAGWGEADVFSTDNPNSCLNSVGDYNPRSSCLMMEVY